MNVLSGQAQSADFRVRNLDPSLRVADPNWSFLRYGRVYIRLSPALWNGWLMGQHAVTGGAGSGFQVVGDRLLQVTSPDGAWLQQPPSPEQQPIEMGGVGYELHAGRSTSPTS